MWLKFSRHQLIIYLFFKNMIGKSKWFSPRKYTGWGFSPNCWQGWLYIALAIIPFIFIKNQIFIYSWGGLLLLDFVDILIHIKRDERDIIHEAISERNALWTMIFILIIGSFVKQTVDPIILIALAGATVIKAVSNFYLRDK